MQPKKQGFFCYLASKCFQILGTLFFSVVSNFASKFKERYFLVFIMEVLFFISFEAINLGPK